MTDEPQTHAGTHVDPPGSVEAGTVADWDPNGNPSVWSFQGRIGRGRFWGVGLILGLGELLTVFLIMGLASGGAGGGVLAVLLGFVWYVIAVWIALANHVKRWHDLGLSGWMVLLNFTIIFIPVSLVMLGFMRGTRGPNQHGADPLGPRGAAAAAEYAAAADAAFSAAAETGTAFRRGGPDASVVIGVALTACGGVQVLSQAATLLLKNVLGSAPELAVLDAATRSTGLVFTVLMILLSSLAVAAGVGLIRRWPWGRPLAIGWAAAALVEVVAGLVVSFLYVMPAAQRTLQSTLGSSLPEVDTTGVAWISVLTQLFGALFMAVLPVLTLVLVGRRRAGDSPV